jgi:signal transduction histidine kinase/ligand-binding sensor domain-containing protein/DNA-binding response OmpR family regulator
MIFVLISLILKAQNTPYQFSHLTVSNGLSNNQITSIFKDSRGFMWFGTVSGLNRYDGFKFKIFNHQLNDSTSLNDNCVINITEGPNQTLWIKTRVGLNIYDPVTEEFIHNPATYITNGTTSRPQITDIYKIDQYNYLFIVPHQGFYLYNEISKKSTHCFHKDSQPTSINGGAISSVVPDIQNNIWIMYNNGLLEKFNTKTNRVLYQTSIVKDADELGLNYASFMDSDGDIWIFSPGGDRGVYLFNTSKQTLNHFSKESASGRLSSNIINCVIQDDNGIIWIATDHGGITLLQKNSFKTDYLVTREDDNKSLAQNSIVALYKDNLGIVWGGTYKKGINYYHKDIIKFPLIHHNPADRNSLPYDDVNRFAEDDKGNLWIGTNGDGLIYFDRLANTFILYKHSAVNKNSIGNDVIVSLCIDHEKKLWIGSYFGGLDCFDGKTFVHYKHDESNLASLSDDRVWEITEDASNNLWVGTLAGGLNKLDRKTGGFSHYKFGDKNSIHSNYISSILNDKAGNIWISTSWGIDELKKSGVIVHYYHRQNCKSCLIFNNISNLFIDSRGWVWAATREGVSVLNPVTGRFKNIRKENGLPDNSVKDVLEDNAHNIWLSTSNGLSNMIIENTNHDNLTYKLNNYDEADGLQGLDFNESASFKTRKGELIFGGANGFNIFNPVNITPTDNKPEVVLTDLQLFTKNVAPGQKINGHVILPKSISESKQITLKYDENVFSIEFAALDFFNPDKTKIQYILQGYDKSWLNTDNKTRKVTYTNLDQGDYTFKIRAYNDKLSGKTLMLHIIVMPPFWKSTIAYFIYFLLFVVGLYSIRRRGINKIKARFAFEQEREQAHRLHELDMMKIKFFTNVNHEFRTPLALILAPIDKILKQTQNPEHVQQIQLISRNARRLLNMVNQLLDFRKIEEQELQLQSVKGDIISFIEEVAMSFSDIAEKKNISFVFDSDTDLFETDFDHDKIERILFNLLSNAFKFTKEHGHVSILLNLQRNDRLDNDILEIKVIDTGIGIPAKKLGKIFERFFQSEVPDYMVNQGSGIGLAITKEFVKLHQGEITVESEENEGSCFTVRLPLINNNKNSVDMANAIIHQSETLPAAAEKSSGKKPTVLLVEDNNDFRFYLKDNLKEYFHIIEAINGKEGWQKALALHPNLIVSDISMPEMNGIDLCTKLKNDSRTTHIPVILLTALTGEEQQLKGLNTGASDYLTKPFNFEILLSKIKNSLSQQDRMRKTYSKQVEINPSEIVVESPDELFVNKALQVIEHNIANAEFSVEELSSEMCMSRVTLYKKTLQLTGKSPVELIRTVRLKRATQLLENGYLTISQVSYKVGFKSQKYFTRSFKSEYNMLPSEYLATKKEEISK